MTGPQRRLSIRDGGAMSLRFEWGSRTGAPLPTWATVEWAGRVGHPSSYALVGGAPSSAPGIAVPPEAAQFKDSLAASADDVRWGLPSEYEQAVFDVLGAYPRPITVSRAAHGAVGSSEASFRGVTRMLCQILAAGLPVDDAELWRLRDSCWE